jgi:hypothetical protein
MYGVGFVGTLHSSSPPRGVTSVAQAAKSAVALKPDELEKRAHEFLGRLDAQFTQALSAKVDRLAAKLLARGLVTQATDGTYLPGLPAQVSPRYARARNMPAKAWRRAEFGIRRGLNRPRTTGSKAFKSGGDARTLVSTVTGSSATVWAGSSLFRTAFNGATASSGSGFEPPAGGLEVLGIAGGVAAGCSLLDGLDMFNTFLDTVDEQDRWKVEVVVFHRHFNAYFANRRTGTPSSPEVIHGFLRCKAALSRCALFDKPTRQALRRCCAAAVRDAGASSLTALLSTAGMGMKIQSGADLVSLGLGTAGMALAAAGVPFSLACAGIDIAVGLGEISFRKKEYRSCKARCLQLQRQIDELKETVPGFDGADRKALLDMLTGALKRQRRLRKQARYEMRFGAARVTKGVTNAAVSAPLATAAIVTGAVATAAVAWPIGVAATAVSGVVLTGYLGTYSVKAATREELRSRSRSELYDATLLAATTSAADRMRLVAAQRKCSVAGTRGYWTGGRDGFAGSYTHDVTSEAQVVAALDEFAALVARRPARGPHPDAEVETHIKALLATDDIDEDLFNDIERMIRAGSDDLRAQGAHPRDIEWQELMTRRERYAGAFGLPPAAPRLPMGALLPSFHAACWIARLSGSDDLDAKKFVGRLNRHLRGEQVDLHAMNEWLDRHGHLATSSPLTTAQMQAAAGHLFRSVPPALFMDQTKALLKAIGKEAGRRKAFGWQDDSPVLRDLTAFSEFAQTQWIPGDRVLRACTHPVRGAAAGARWCTVDELWTAGRHLASGGSTLPPWNSQEERRALKAILRKEWARRFGAEGRGARRRTAAALAEYCARRTKFAGRTWSSDSKGGFYCDLGGREVAVVPAATLAQWVTQGDWDRPLSIEIRSLAPASAMRWLSREPGADVDERFIGEAGVAATLENLKTAFVAGPRNSGKRVHECLISQDGIALPLQFAQLKDMMGATRRVALAEPFAPASTRRWGLVENTTPQDGAEQWQFTVVAGSEPVIHPSLDAAVRDYCRMSGLDAVRAVFIADPA